MRETHGIKPGDEMRILTTPDGFQLVKDSAPSVFEAWRGIGNPDIGIGREAIQKYMREIRGYDEYDDLLG
jgi:bifunctional DNA-binding transcriptional regulator/antitoxin component of YhaV-PrlF toxin-antitoxin module